ncbi:MAG: hypothetical protein AAFY71_24490 [Bacteroidota bacterium]
MKTRFILPIILITTLCSCTEWLTYDVSESRLTLISPSDSLFSSSEELIFRWEENDSAEFYRIQIVSPNLSDPISFFDTLVEENLLPLTLNEGIYQWRVQISNTSSSSDFQNRTLIIDTTAPNIPKLLFPDNQATLAMADSIIFQWRSVDPPIQNQQFPWRDKLTVNAIDQGQRVSLGSFDLSGRELNSYAVATKGFPTIEWRIKSYDMAGNETQSEEGLVILQQ